MKEKHQPAAAAGKAQGGQAEGGAVHGEGAWLRGGRTVPPTPVGQPPLRCFHRSCHPLGPSLARPTVQGPWVPSETLCPQPPAWGRWLPLPTHPLLPLACPFGNLSWVGGGRPASQGKAVCGLSSGRSPPHPIWSC